jgi:hypothetical protein
MKPTPIVCSLLLAACAAPPSPSSGPVAADGAFRVTVLGDMPYVGVDDPLRAVVLEAYEAVLDTVAAEEAAFVVHVGDLTGAVCSDSLLRQRQREFAAIPRPLVYTPGDNEWTDCARDGYEPLERLSRLRELFAAAEREGLRGIALFMQANPFGGLERRPPEAPPSGFTELMLELRRLTLESERPVLLVHGDSHTFRTDKPLTDELGRSLFHFTRAETFGSPDLHALRIVVDPRDPNLFRAEPLLVPANAAR